MSAEVAAVVPEKKWFSSFRAKPDAWVELGLTLPIFILYHLGVIFLDTKNGTDFVTGQILELAHGGTGVYLGITLAIGIAFAIPFVLLARGQVFHPRKFIQMAIEGTVYATVLGLAVPKVVAFLLDVGSKDVPPQGGIFSGFISSLGAGFYEELAFRVVLFGLGGKALVWLLSKEKPSAIASVSVQESGLTMRTMGVLLGWAVVCSMLFSGMHYIGALGDSFQVRSFVYRWLFGLALTLIFSTRGFAVAVWTHAIYDIWVLALK
jgi:hypothetical protein